VAQRPLAAVVHQGRASWSVPHPVETAQATSQTVRRPQTDLLDHSLPLLFAGTGAAYCQILDSIYGDVPMARVKFTSKSVASRTVHRHERGSLTLVPSSSLSLPLRACRQEYEHLANYKVLQNIFKNHGIDKVRSHSSPSKLRSTVAFLPSSVARSPSRWIDSSSARCRTTSSSCSGSRSTGICSFRGESTMLSHGGRDWEVNVSACFSCMGGIACKYMRGEGRRGARH
jgi:hypothetical protein